MINYNECPNCKVDGVYDYEDGICSCPECGLVIWETVVEEFDEAYFWENNVIRP